MVGITADEFFYDNLYLDFHYQEYIYLRMINFKLFRNLFAHESLSLIYFEIITHKSTIGQYGDPTTTTTVIVEVISGRIQN